MGDAYADFIESLGDVHGSVSDVHGASADVAVTYTIPTKQHGALRWSIDGALHFIHGRYGWLVDRDYWYDRKLVAIVRPDGIVDPVTESTISADESVRFFVGGVPFEWTRLPNLSWKISSLATMIPQPSPVSVGGFAADTPPAKASPLYVPPNSSMPEVAPSYGPPPIGDAGCEEVDVTGVYGDGEILETDTGSRLRVSDADTSVSSVWVAPFTGLLCDGNSKLIDKDDDESVDLDP